MAAVALGCGVVAAPMIVAGTASASPMTCDGAGCVTYIHRDAAEGAPCEPNTRYNFGLDASGNTLACSSSRKWISSPPLVGIRVAGTQCGGETGMAQAPDGLPLSCTGGFWRPDWRAAVY